MNTNYIFTSILLVCSVLLTNAQNNNLSREMLLEKEYVPTLLEASRINTLPELKEPQVEKTAVEYANFILPFPLLATIPAIPAEPIYTRVAESNKKGYANVGVATNTNVDLDLGYQILNKPSDELDVYISHRSLSHKAKYLQDDLKQKRKTSDTWGGVAYAHTFEPFKVFSQFKYMQSSFNYYGYGITPINIVNSLVELDKNSNQGVHLYEFSLGLQSKTDDDLQYLTRFSFYRFNQKEASTKEIAGPKESSGTLDWDINYLYSGENKYGLAGYISGFSYTANQPRLAPYYQGYKGHGRLALNPYLALSDVSWKARIGMKTFITFNYGKILSLAPDLAFSVFPSANSELYFTAGGGFTSNSKYATFLENRYLSPQQKILDTRTNFDGQFGFKANLKSGLWFDLFAGYKVDRDAYFLHSDYPELAFSNTAIANNVLVADIMHAKLFKVGVDLKYKYQDILELGIRTQYNAWKLDNYDYSGALSSKAWNKPKLELDITGGFEFGIPLRLDWLYHIQTGRYTYLTQPYQTVLKMKDIHDLQLTTSYTINQHVSAYIQANNILMQRYDLWYGYPTQGANVLFGATVKF